jgi:hypothetical protein
VNSVHAPTRWALVLLLAAVLGLMGALPWASALGQAEPTASEAAEEPSPVQPTEAPTEATVPDGPADLDPSLEAGAVPEEIADAGAVSEENAETGALLEESAPAEATESAAEEPSPVEPTEGPTDGAPAATEELVPAESADAGPPPDPDLLPEESSDAGTLAEESASADPNADTTPPAAVEADQSGEASEASPETVADLVEAAPDDNVEIVGVENVDLAPADEAAIETLAASSDEFVVAAALVPVYDTPENVVAVLVGEGISFSNVGYVGATVALGSFTGGTGIVGFEDGVILSSGDITSVVGPNTEDGATSNNNTPGDADLSELVDTETFDAAVLTFDFVPQGNTVVFSYVFSSEEYNEYVNSEFNDVFAFYVNGVNCATVDGGRVSVNSINNGNPYGSGTITNPELFVNNDLTDGGGAVNTEMDGLTVVLTCEASVQPGVPNTMKLAIADASDPVLDSNVFIQAKSFVVVTPTPVATATPTTEPGATATPTTVGPTVPAGSETPTVAPGSTTTAAPVATSATGGVTQLPDAGVGGHQSSSYGLVVGLLAAAAAAGLLLVARRLSATR